MSQRPVLFTTPLIVNALETEPVHKRTYLRQIPLWQILTVMLHTALLVVLWRELQLTLETLATLFRRSLRGDSDRRLPTGS